MVTQIDGVPPSTDIRDKLKTTGRPVLLNFSRGKDSIATWLALRELEIPVVPAFQYGVPGLRFVDESLAWFEDYFDTKIARYPHPALYRHLNNFVFQPPERCAVIEAANLPNITYQELDAAMKEDLGLPPDTWTADGVRAADSPVRRMSFKKHGAMKEHSRKVSPIWDWLKAEVLGIMSEHDVPLPPEYEWFGRSFDGLDYRFIEPLKQHAPDDYQTILDWFPLAELELVRHDIR